MSEAIECTGCKEILPENAFWRDPKRKCGIPNECKRCQAKRNSDWRRDNRDRALSINNAASRRMRDNDPKRAMLVAIRSRCKIADIPFDLTIEDLCIPDVCPVLGIKIVPRSGSLGTRGGRDYSPSVDRLNPRKGYVKGNVIIVSWRANRLRSDATLDELRAIVRYYEGVLK